MFFIIFDVNLHKTSHIYVDRQSELSPLRNNFALRCTSFPCRVPLFQLSNVSLAHALMKHVWKNGGLSILENLKVNKVLTSILHISLQAYHIDLKIIAQDMIRNAS